MAVQTTFGFEPAKGVVGSLYDVYTADSNDVMSKTAAAAVKFGRGVFSATATPNVCAVPTSEAEAARLCGVTIEDRTKATTVGYAAGDQVRLLRRGRIRVYFETAMTDMASVYVRVTTDTDGSDLGQFRNDADGGKAILVNNARFLAVDGVQSAAGIGVLEVEFKPGIGLIGPTGPTGPTGPSGS